MRLLRCCTGLIGMIVVSLSAQLTSDLSFEIHNPVRQYSKVKCRMLLSGPDSEMLSKIAHIARFDLEFSDQLEVELGAYTGQVGDALLKKLFNEGTLLCVQVRHLSKSAEQDKLNLVVKETSAGTVLFEKTVPLQRASLIHTIHALSDEVLPALTGKNGPMLSSLAYCKSISSRHKVVCVADYACKLEKIVAQAKTINTAPRWHSQAPVLFYSQFTRSNGRLMSCDMRTRQHKVICSFDGLNMQPSFSPDGTKAVLCLSGEQNSEIYFYDQIESKTNKKRTFKPLTHNGGNNSSPCFLPNGNVIFCSDFESRFPQLYLLDGSSHRVSKITNGRGYCAAPSYCRRTNAVVYTRYIDGVFQLCFIDLSIKPYKEHQLTRCGGDKTDPSWSECGGYVAFAYNYIDPATKKRSNQIAILNLLSGKIRVVTTGKEPKSFPAWTSRDLYMA